MGWCFIFCRIVLINISLLLFLQGSCFSAPKTTPAGSELKSSSEVQINGIIKSVKSSIAVKVPQIFGLNIKPSDIDLKIPSGTTTYTLFEIENIGNGTDRVLLDFEHPKMELGFKLIVDENKDGIHQKEEKTEVPLSLVLSEGASYYFFVELIAPKNIKKGYWVWIAISVKSSGYDGEAYTGYNGMNYGGDDKTSSMISAFVE